MKGKRIFKYLQLIVIFIMILTLKNLYQENMLEVAIAAEVSETPAPTEPVETSVSIKADYVTGIFTVMKGSRGSDKFYFSIDKKKTWELIETADGTIDVRGLMKSSAVTIYFKGNKDKEPLEYVIPAEDKGLKVKYAVVEGKGRINYEGLPPGRILEYRINVNGSWMEYPSAGISTQMYEVTGASFQFRIKATVNAREGKVTPLKIPKRAKSPSIKVSGSTLSFTGLKNGVIEYRVIENAGKSLSNPAWTAFKPSDSKVKSLSVASLAAEGTTTYKENDRIPSIIVEFRNIATEKSPNSAIRTIELEAQKSAPTAATVQLNGTTLTLSDASSKNPYEILVLHKGETPDLSKDKWKSVTNPKPQLIKKAGKADIIPTDLIYIRYKASKDSASGLETMASCYMVIEVSRLSQSLEPTAPTAAPTIPAENYIVGSKQF